MKYKEYIVSPEWAATRNVAIARANYKCEICPRSCELQVHHRTYERFGQELPGDLLVVCIRCHNDIHWALRCVTPNERMLRQGTIITEEMYCQESQKKPMGKKAK